MWISEGLITGLGYGLSITNDKPMIISLYIIGIWTICNVASPLQITMEAGVSGIYWLIEVLYFYENISGNLLIIIFQNFVKLCTGLTLLD